MRAQSQFPCPYVSDMMALPVELADDSGDVIQVETSTETVEETPLVDPDESLTETTHANFLSLVRALFPARAAHRASKQQLHARCMAVMRSPIAPLNTWYNCKLFYIVTSSISKLIAKTQAVVHKLSVEW